MSFRRLPFGFSATSPLERQAELFRRFGVRPEEDTMFTENPNDNFVDGFSRSSPRLQHRVPGVMTEGRPIKVEYQGCADNVDSPKAEPRVRVIPIHIEGRDDDSQNNRSRNFSGGSIPNKKVNLGNEDYTRQRTNSGSFVPRTNTEFFPNQSTYQSEHEDLRSDFSNSKTKVCNIPIRVEGQSKGEKLRQCRSVPIKKEVPNKSSFKMGNGPCVSKSATEPSVSNVKNDPKPNFETSLKKIEQILEEFKPFEDDVSKFSGVQGDKQYRYLDEMLTRCILKLDNVDTFCNEDVRKFRKAAVKRIEDAANSLEMKVQEKDKSEKLESVQNTEKLDTEKSDAETKPVAMDIEMTESTVENDKEVILSTEIEHDLITNPENNLVSKSEVIESCVPEDSCNVKENEKKSSLSQENLIEKTESKSNLKNPDIVNSSISQENETLNVINNPAINNKLCEQLENPKDCEENNSVDMDCTEKNLSCSQTVNVNDVEMKDIENQSEFKDENALPSTI